MDLETKFLNEIQNGNYKKEVWFGYECLNKHSLEIDTEEQINAKEIITKYKNYFSKILKNRMYEEQNYDYCWRVYKSLTNYLILNQEDNYDVLTIKFSEYENKQVDKDNLLLAYALKLEETFTDRSNYLYLKRIGKDTITFIFEDFKINLQIKVSNSKKTQYVDIEIVLNSTEITNVISWEKVGKLARRMDSFSKIKDKLDTTMNKIPFIKFIDLCPNELVIFFE